MRHLLVLALVLVVSIAGASSYMLMANPEMSFARLVFAEQQRQLAETRGEPRVILVGGSSCSFSIDPELLATEFGLAACNLGQPAGTGRGLHLERALQEAGRGDVVVLAFEMTGWTGEEGDLITPLGSQLWYGGLRAYAGGDSQLGQLGLAEGYEINALRPGGKHCMTMAMKLALGKPIFRYEEETIRTGGYLQNTSHDWPIQPRRSVADYRLDPQLGDLLGRFVKVMEKRGAGVVITLPWYFTHPSVADEQRGANRRLIAELQEWAPVLPDEHLGVETSRELFSDSNWHLSDQGAQLRTREFGKGMKAWMTGGEDA